MMYMPVWLLYWFPFVLPVNYFIKFLLVIFTLFVISIFHKSEKVLKIENIIKLGCFSIIAEIVGIGAFYIMESSINTNTYYKYYAIFSAIAFLIVLILNYLMNYNWCFKNMTPKKKAIAICIITVLASAPYLFLLPSSIYME